jgi:preprotein translocase subunit SecD
VRLATVVVFAVVAAGCGSGHGNEDWFRIVGEGGVGPTLTAADVVHSSAQSAVDPATQAPTVVFRFTPPGAEKFRRLTRGLARAGKRAGRPYHFAIIVDGRTLNRPYVDYRVFPAGVAGDAGVQLTLHRQREAERLAKRLRRS